MNQNLDNCPLHLNSKAHTTLKIGNFHIKNFLCKKLLSIDFDYKLNLAKHIEVIRQLAARKVNAFLRLAPYMTPSTKRIQIMLS